MKKIKKLIAIFIPWIDQSSKIYKLYKKSHDNYKNGHVFISSWFSYKIYKKYHCQITPGAEIDSSVSFPHPFGITIGMDSVVGKNCTIYHNVTIGQKDWKYPVIGDNVTIYEGAVIVGDVKIGNNSIIGPNSIVITDVPDNSIIVSSPSRKINKQS